MYIEQNSGSFRRCPDTSELGMDAGLIKSIKKHGVKIKTASDAHCPEDVGQYIKDLFVLEDIDGRWIAFGMKQK